MRIVVLGYIVRGPYGGLVWHHLQYLLGLKQLGHEILFLEDSDDYPSCSSPASPELTSNPSYGLHFIQQAFERFGLKNNWAYYDAHTNNWFGLSKREVLLFCNRADLVLNLSAINPLRDWWCKIPIRVLVDTDPVFTQIRHLQNKQDRDVAASHTAFFSFGENTGKPGCLIPNDGFDWQPTRQPLFLKAWPCTPGRKHANWTTVMQWDSYKTAEHEGRLFGMKSSSFDDYFSLPQKTAETFELAVGSATAPKTKLQANGWHLADPLSVTESPATYQQFIQRSKGEWSVAKQGYVADNSGWFSERTTGYLASGRPAVVMETGFSAFIETGKGLFSFSSAEDVLAAFETINGNYQAHCRWARELAEDCFDSNNVLSSLLQRCTTSVPAV